jgi:hypothetical protein
VPFFRDDFCNHRAPRSAADDADIVFLFQDCCSFR